MEEEDEVMMILYICRDLFWMLGCVGIGGLGLWM